MKWPVKDTITTHCSWQLWYQLAQGNILLLIHTFLLTFFACDDVRTVLACQVATTLTLFTSGLYGTVVGELLCLVSALALLVVLVNAVSAKSVRSCVCVHNPVGNLTEILFLARTNFH